MRCNLGVPRSTQKQNEQLRKTRTSTFGLVTSGKIPTDCFRDCLEI